MSSLHDDLHALASGGPAVPDWPGLVRGTVRARRRRRTAVVGAAALALVVGSAAGVVYAAGDARDPSTLVVATRPPTPSSSSAAGGNVVTVEIEVSPSRPKVGEEVTITIIARGDKGGVRLSLISFDRGRQTEMAPSVSCPQAEPAEPKAGFARRDITFVYSEAYTDTVLARADSGCGYFSGGGEARKDVTVDPKEIGPTAAPTLRPTSEPAPTYPPARNVVSIDITVSPARPKVGEEVTITVVARGDRGGVRFERISFDRGRKGLQGSDYSCAPAEPVAPEPGEAREQFTVVYDEAFTDSVLASVDSGCGYYQGSGSKTVEVVVEPADGPTPTPA